MQNSHTYKAGIFNPLPAGLVLPLQNKKSRRDCISATQRVK